MSFYRIYPLDRTGRIQLPLEADCADDGEAIRHARGLGGRIRHGCEVWHATRFLGRFHFEGEPGAGAAGRNALPEVAPTA